MGRRSSIEQLPAPIRQAVDQAIAAGATIDTIVERIEAMGGEASRSAVGRYSQNWRDLAARQRDLSAVATSFAADFGNQDDHQVKLLIQLMTSILTQAALPIASGEGPEMDAKELHFFARAIKDAVSAAKTETDREAKLREQERRKAAEKAAQSLKKGGASDAMIDTVKREILGLKE